MFKNIANVYLKYFNNNTKWFSAKAYIIVFTQFKIYSFKIKTLFYLTYIIRIQYKYTSNTFSRRQRFFDGKNYRRANLKKKHSTSTIVPNYNSKKKVEQ